MPIEIDVVSDARDITFPCVPNTAYEIGDLLYSNSGVATKAASQADAGSAADNQAAFAPLFLGVCKSRRLAMEATPPRILVGTDMVVDADADSASYVVGEMVTVSRNAAVPANRNQQVAKTATAGSAIGRVVATTGGTATKVRVRLKSNII